MAHDLAGTAHLGYSDPALRRCPRRQFRGLCLPARRRHLLFGLNDFDETLPGPWEWDVKRLAASVVVAGREAGLDDGAIRQIVVDAVIGYADAARSHAEQSALDIWYLQYDVEEYRRQATSSGSQAKAVAKAVTKALLEHQLACPRQAHHPG